MTTEPFSRLAARRLTARRAAQSFVIRRGARRETVGEGAAVFEVGVLAESLQRAGRPPVIPVAVFAARRRRFRVSAVACGLLTWFFCVQCVGGRWTFAEVPIPEAVMELSRREEPLRLEESLRRKRLEAAAPQREEPRRPRPLLPLRCARRQG